jgi:hypothetical protein
MISSPEQRRGDAGVTAPPRAPRACLPAVANIAARVYLLGLLVLAGPMGGCFSLQQPACAFSCAEPPNRCPEGYSCGDDRICHRSDGARDVTACPLTAPAPAPDASVDAASVALD